MNQENPIKLLVLVASLAAFACGANASDDPEGGVWNDASDAVDMTVSTWPQGSIRFQNPRAKLTSEQSALLGELRVVEPDPECLVDGAWGTVAVTTDGTSTDYRAAEGDRSCGQPGTFVGYDAVEALVHATACEPSWGASPTAEGARRIGVNTGCYEFMSDGADGPSSWWLLVDAAAAGEHRVSFDACGTVQPLAVLYDASGLTEVARAAAGAGECPTLALDVPAAGAYALRVSVQASMRVGDTFYVRVDSGT